MSLLCSEPSRGTLGTRAKAKVSTVAYEALRERDLAPITTAPLWCP